MKKKVLKARIAELENTLNSMYINNYLLLRKVSSYESILTCKQEQLKKASSERLLMGEQIKNYKHQLNMTSNQLAKAEAELAKLNPSYTATN